MKATPRVITSLTCARRLPRPKKGLICNDDPGNALRSQSCITREPTARLLAHLLLDREKNREDEKPPNLFGLIVILNLRSNSF